MPYRYYCPPDIDLATFLLFNGEKATATSITSVPWSFMKSGSLALSFIDRYFMVEDDWIHR
jgi:hypothetical protein